MSLFIVNYNRMLCDNQVRSFEHAASRWGVELAIVTENDLSISYHPGAVKLSAFELCDAERICILDADTIIRADCPSPFEKFPSEIITACINKQPHLAPFYLQAASVIEPKEMKLILEAKPEGTVNFDYKHYINTGFLVAERHSHQHVFELARHIYLSVDGFGWHDQTPLNYAIAYTKAGVHLADLTWNYCMPGNQLRMHKWIYHYAGSPERYDILRKIDWQEIPNN